MIKLKMSIEDINEYQTGILPENAVKIEIPQRIDEMMKKAAPIAVETYMIQKIILKGLESECISYGSIYQVNYLKKNRLTYCVMQMIHYLGEMKSNAENYMRRLCFIMIIDSILIMRAIECQLIWFKGADKMINKNIFFLLGCPCSGKTTVGEMLSEKYVNSFF